ncbi:MAG: ATP-binding cassette domain-containing protein, partial [Planctomycetia bacterium]
MSLVSTESLVKRYKTFTALAGVDLTIEPGEIYGLLGPNGAGKTTLLRLLMGFLRPTSGTATVLGLDCHRDLVRVHEKVSYLPGEVRLFPFMRGRDVLEFLSK